MENTRSNSYTVASFFTNQADGYLQEKEKMSFRQSRGHDGSFHSELLEHENKMPEEKWETCLKKMMQQAGEMVSVYLSQHPAQSIE
jgi:hypothetical protein